MDNGLILREFQKDDAEALEAIICEAWHYNDLCTVKTAHKLSKVFLSSCLTNQTYTQTAVLNGMPVGVIMADNRRTHKCPIRYRIHQLLAVLSLFLSGEGRKVSNIFSCVSNIDQQLLAECKTDYQGEVSFFAVADTMRKKGVGTQLFHSMLDYMKSQNIKIFFFSLIQAVTMDSTNIRV